MGRLLRKKPAAKKKKKAEEEKPGQGQGAESVAASPAQAVVPAAPKQPIGFKTPAAVLRGPKFWVAIVQFLREVRMELKKVTWPSRKQTMGTTVVVLILVLILAVYLGLVDAGLSGLVHLVLQ